MATPYTRVYDFTGGQRVRSGEVDDEFNAIITAFGKVLAGSVDVGVATTPVSDNAIILTHDPVRTVNTAGDAIIFKAEASTTGAVTVQVDSIAAVALLGVTAEALTTGAILAGTFYEARYNGTSFQLMQTDVALATDVTQVQGASTSLPTTPGGAFNATMPWRNNRASPGPDDLASIGFAGDDFRVLSLTHGGSILFSAEDESGMAQQLLKLDPDAVESTFTNVDVDAFAGPSVRLHRDPGEAGADDDYLGELIFSGMDDAGTPASVNYARIFGRIFDATALSNDGQLEFEVMVNDTPTTVLKLDPSGVTATGDFAISGSVTGTDLDLDAGDDVLTELGLRNTSGGILLQVDLSTGLGHIAQQSGAGSDEEDWITLARNGAVNLFYNGTAVARTTSIGVDLLGIISSIQNTVSDLSLFYLRGDTVAGAGGAALRSGTGTFSIFQTSRAGGTEDTWISAARDGAVSLYFNDTAKLATRANGVQLFGQRLFCRNEDEGAENDFTVLHLEGNQESTGVGLKSHTGGYSVTQRASTDYAVQKYWLTAEVDAGVRLYHNSPTFAAGDEKLATTATGVNITGTVFSIDPGADSVTEYRALNDTNGLRLLAQASDGGFELRQLSAAAADEGAWITGLNDGSVTLYYNGAHAIQTADPTIGDADMPPSGGTGANVIDGTGVSKPVGYNVVPLRDSLVDGIAFDLAHNGFAHHAKVSEGTGQAFLCNRDDDVPVGATYLVINEGEAVIQITPNTASLWFFDGADVSGGGATVALAKGGVATVYKYQTGATTKFFVWGMGLS